jgi:hypothetical protein
MKKRIFFAVLAAMTMVIVMTGAAIAASLTPTVTATGTVTDTCSAPTNGAISFTIDPSAAGPINALTTDAGNTAPTVKCTNGASHAVTCTSVANVLSIGDDDATDPISYAITGCPANITGTGFAAGTPIDFGIQLVAADYQNAQAGAHVDVITVTVTY